MTPDQIHRILPALFNIPNTWSNTIYVHVPFCVKRCSFCVYPSKLPSDRTETDTFLSHLLGELSDLEDTFRQVQFNELYLGGGTPTTLTARQLDRFLCAIPNLGGISKKASEISPKTVREEHIALFSQYNFTYVSLGLQTIKQDVLTALNREETDLEKVADVVDQLERAGILTNIDLIFFVRSGSLADLEDARADLRFVFNELRPSSITVHSNYNAAKTIEKQQAMLRLLQEELSSQSSYQCTNSLLLDIDAKADMHNAAEYRLMRRSPDFEFRYSGKIPEAVRFGYNMLALGHYDTIHPRSNYFYVSDAYSANASGSVLSSARARETELAETRQRLGFRSASIAGLNTFFSDERHRHLFEHILKEAGHPIVQEWA
jgi:coproporphyrinogen III oxidase-like Fe-S oxidoreductase